MTASERTTVLVVGAGPSGLTLAHVLARAGVPSVLIDRDSGPVPQSRAAIVHTRTLELWDRWGLAEPAVAAGSEVERVRMRAAGHELASFPIAGVEASPFPFALALPQDRTERLLLRELTPRWRTELVGFDSGANGVRAVVRREDGSLSEIHARYLVGADGAHSIVRRLAGIAAPTSGRAPTGFLADVRLTPAPPRGTIDLNLARGGFVGALRLDDERFRLFGALQPDYAAKFDVLSVQVLQRMFDEYFRIPLHVSEVDWTAIYRIRHRVAETFRAGPVFLVGDAAHLHAPAGGQGMNLGIGDAVNLGWKLALTARGLARESLLDTYDSERRRIARTVSRGADRGFALETTSNPAVEWARKRLLPVVIRTASQFPFSRKAIHRLFAQTWISYRTGRGHGLQPGDRAPEASMGNGSVYSVCAEPVHHLLLFGATEEARSLVDSYETEIRLHKVEPGDVPLRRAYGMDTPTAVLIRPDAHIAAIAPAHDLAPVRRHLDRWYR